MIYYLNKLYPNRLSEKWSKFFMNDNVETFEQVYNRSKLSGESSFVFNGCEIPLDESTSEKEAWGYYVHNVDLSQFWRT